MKEISRHDYAQMVKLMDANRGYGDDPKVGLFWYHTVRKELFGVVSQPILDFTRANALGWATCSESYEEVWLRELNRQARQGVIDGPFIGKLEDYPRGRVYYHMEEDRYVVAVGHWLEEHPEAKELILDEFDLPASKTTFEYAIHWDIGHSLR